VSWFSPPAPPLKRLLVSVHYEQRDETGGWSSQTIEGIIDGHADPATGRYRVHDVDGRYYLTHAERVYSVDERAKVTGETAIDRSRVILVQILGEDAR